MSTLRKAALALAHAKPELREHLLPLLREASYNDPALKGLLEAIEQEITKAVRSKAGKWDLSPHGRMESKFQHGKGWASGEWGGEILYAWTVPVRALRDFSWPPDRRAQQQIVDEIEDEVLNTAEELLFQFDNRGIDPDDFDVEMGTTDVYGLIEDLTEGRAGQTTVFHEEVTRVTVGKKKGMLALQGTLSYSGTHEDIDESLARGHF